MKKIKNKRKKNKITIYLTHFSKILLIQKKIVFFKLVIFKKVYNKKYLLIINPMIINKFLKKNKMKMKKMIIMNSKVFTIVYLLQKNNPIHDSHLLRIKILK